MNKKTRNIVLAVSITAGGIFLLVLSVLFFTVAWAFLHTNKNAVASALNSEVYNSADCLYYDVKRGRCSHLYLKRGKESFETKNQNRL